MRVAYAILMILILIMALLFTLFLVVIIWAEILIIQDKRNEVEAHDGIQHTTDII